MDFVPLKNAISDVINNTYDGNATYSVDEIAIRDVMDKMMDEVIGLEQAQQIRGIKALATAENLYVEVLSHLASGSKINAIKYVRNFTNWSLLDAKNFVDRIDDAAGHLSKSAI